MSNYRRGADFERAVRAHLAENGYEVIRSAGSKTKVDLVAIKTGDLLLIQCKLPNSQVSSGDWNKLRTLARQCDGRPILAIKVANSSRPLFQELLADAPDGRRREMGVHWIAWFPDPLGER